MIAADIRSVHHTGVPMAPECCPWFVSRREAREYVAMHSRLYAAQRVVR